MRGGALAFPRTVKETDIPGDRPGELNIIEETVSRMEWRRASVSRQRSSQIEAEASPARLRAAR